MVFVSLRRGALAVSWVIATDDGHCPDDLCDEYERAWISAPPKGRYVDDVTGNDLPPGLARQGRIEGLAGFHSKPVYEITSRADAKRRGIKMIETRWVDKLKGPMCVVASALRT